MDAPTTQPLLGGITVWRAPSPSAPLRTDGCRSADGSRDRLGCQAWQSNEVIAPIAGLISRALGISAGDYLALVERTGRQIHPGKRGGGVGPLPAALRRLDYNEDSWTGQVLGVGSAYPKV